MAVAAAASPRPEPVDVPTGTTPRDVVWTRNKTTLYRYRPLAPREHATPVLLVYALINRPYILDLRPDNSFVRHLLGHGYDVFLIDWGAPGRRGPRDHLDELIGEHLPKAVGAHGARRRRRRVHADRATAWAARWARSTRRCSPRACATWSR